MLATKLTNRTLRRNGQEIWLYPERGTRVQMPIRGLFQEEQVVSDPVQGREVRVRQPSIVVPEEEAVNMRRGDRVITNDTEYEADDIERSMQGTRITLVLPEDES